MQNINSPQFWYGDMYKEDRFAKNRIAICAALIKPYCKLNINLLDIGCYTAELFDFLPPNLNYLGIDFDDKALEVAKKKGINVRKIIFDKDEIVLDKKFDIIICCEVIEHLKFPHKLIINIKKLLKDDGIVLFSLPNECTFYHRIMCLLGKGIDYCVFQPHKHLHFPTISQGRGFLNEYFKIISTSYYANPGGKGSRWESLGKITSLIPYGFWQGLANFFPGLFARGVIFLCKQYEP